MVKLLLYYIYSLLIAALLTPLIFHGALLWQTTWPSPLLAHWIDKGFGIFFERVRLGALVLFLPALYRSQTLLLKKPTSFFRYAFLGIGLMSIVTWCSSLEYTFHITAAFVLKSFIGALLLAILEEWIFRGILLQSLRTYLPTLIAMFLSSLIFAYLHFRPQFVAQVDSTFGSGFEYLYRYLFEIQIPWPRFWLIASFGFLLSSVTIAHHLGAAIGLHFGSVFALMLLRKSGLSVDVVTEMPVTYILIYTLSTCFLLKNFFERKRHANDNE